MCVHTTVYTRHLNNCSILGLLTVDTKSRLTLSDLATHQWLVPQSAPSTPLCTSCVLGRSRAKQTESAIKQTFIAFQKATRAGFMLGDVSRAPLAKRRRIKKERSPLQSSSSAEANEQTPEHNSVRPNKLDLLMLHDS